MRADEVVALGELAGDALGEGARQVESIHAGIAERVFAAVGPASEPVRAIHDGIAQGVYLGVRTALRAGIRAGAAGFSSTRATDAPPLGASARGRVTIGALNGAFGDRLARRDSALTVPMTLHRGGRELDPRARLAVFVHGLCETDAAWRFASDRCVPYGHRLESELGYTSLYLNYNSGRHISENGRELADLLERFVGEWPVEVEEIVFIGHSMGGLVCRSACHYGALSGWAAKVRHVFTLGAPHLGAPLEQAANAASVALARLPETRGVARALNVRSAGIKDLRYGYLIDEDWLGHDPDAFLRNTGREIPFLDSANHYFVAATLSREAHAPVGRLIGDLLVLRASAWGHRRRGERLRFPIENYRHLGGAHHFDLLNHPAIYEQLRLWLVGRPALPAPA
jgi:triacylglycerol esterase/lipase EstA (alpha/beta hydrolase family)